jgi:hypothetical protein
MFPTSVSLDSVRVPDRPPPPYNPPSSCLRHHRVSLSLSHCPLQSKLTRGIFNFLFLITPVRRRSTEFPERPGALRKFLSSLRNMGWNISLFHYRNQGAGTLTPSLSLVPKIRITDNACPGRLPRSRESFSRDPGT